MLELVFSLFNDKRNYHTRDQRQSNRDNGWKVECLSRCDSTLEDVKDRERCGDGIQLDSLGFLLADSSQDWVVHVLGIVRYRLLTSSINEHIDLEVVFVICFVSLVDLVWAEAIWLWLTNMLLLIHIFIIVFVGNTLFIVVCDVPITWVVR